MLHTRKQQVTIVSQNNENKLSLTQEELKNGEEIENYIVKYVINKHNNFISCLDQNVK